MVDGVGVAVIELFKNKVKLGVKPVPTYDNKLLVMFLVKVEDRMLWELIVKTWESPSSRVNPEEFGEVVSWVRGVLPEVKPVPETEILDLIKSIVTSSPVELVTDASPLTDAELIRN